MTALFTPLYQGALRISALNPQSGLGATALEDVKKNRIYGPFFRLIDKIICCRIRIDPVALGCSRIEYFLIIQKSKGHYEIQVSFAGLYGQAFGRIGVGGYSGGYSLLQQSRDHRTRRPNGYAWPVSVQHIIFLTILANIQIWQKYANHDDLVIRALKKSSRLSWRPHPLATNN